MSGPAAILFSSDGYELSTISGSAIPTGTRGILMEGSDGTNARFLSVDSSGRVVMVGAGTAGTPTGGVLSIQGVSGGQPVPVSGTITATNASTSATGAAPPASATYVGGSVTTAAPTYTTGQMNALSLTTSGSLRVDGSGSTQPVSGTVTANIGTTGGLALDATLAKLTIAQSTALGSNTQALVGGSVTTAAPTYTTGNINPLSLTTAGALRVDGSGSTQPVSGTVTANAGTGNFTVVQATASNLNANVSGTVTANIGTSGALALDATLTGGTQRTKITDGTTNAAVKAASTAAIATDPALVVAISPNNSIAVITDKCTTGTITSVASSVSNTTLLASNANRVSATIYNASNKTMYIALAASASTTSYTIQVFQNSYWELPTSYTGAISAVWATGPTGSALITELT